MEEFPSPGGSLAEPHVKCATLVTERGAGRAFRPLGRTSTFNYLLVVHSVFKSGDAAASKEYRQANALERDTDGRTYPKTEA